MSWTVVADALAAALLLAGCLFSLVAALGVLRLPDLLTRMHAATKPQVIGLMLVLVGVALRLRDPAVLGAMALVVVLQMATSVVAGHMLARASFRAGQVRHDLLVLDELSERHDGRQEPRGAP